MRAGRGPKVAGHRAPANAPIDVVTDVPADTCADSGTA